MAMGRVDRDRQSLVGEHRSRRDQQLQRRTTDAGSMSARPILPCHECKTSDFVWAEPCAYGEGGRYIRYEARCESCGTRASAKGFSGFDTTDQAIEAWNSLQRGKTK